MPFPNEFNEYWESPSRTISVRVEFGTFSTIGQQITSDDWLISANVTQEYCSGKFELGKAMASECKLKFYNPFKVPSPVDGSLMEGSLEWERIAFTVWPTAAKDDGTYHTGYLGEFYAETVESDDGWNTISITAYDWMSKLDVTYEPAIEFPATVTDIWYDLNRYLPNTTPSYFTMSHRDWLSPESMGDAFNSVQYDYSEATVRDYIGWIAGMLGANASYNDGQLLFVRPWQYNGAQEDGTPYGITRDIQYLGESSLCADEPFTVNSITFENSENSYTAGNGTGITIESKFATQESAQYVLDRLNGFTYYPVSCKYRGTPNIEPGECWYFEDSPGHYVNTLIMSCTYDMEDGFSSTIESYKTEDEVYIQTGPTEQAIQRVYNNLQAAIKEAAEVLKGAHGGIFRITDADNDGVNDGFIIADSESTNAVTKCIVANYEGIGFSSDGGRTYQQAITHDGIVADAITTGQLDASRVRINGNTLTDYVDIDSTGIRIGSAESGIVMKQTSDKLSFLSADGDELAHFSPEAFSIEKLLRFRLGKAQIVVQPNGSLSLTKSR